MKRWPWIIIVAGIGIALILVLAFRYEAKLAPGAATFTAAQMWSALWGVLFLLSILIVCVLAAEDQRDFLNLFVLAATGGALGWVIGIVATPQSSDESRVFGEYKTAIVGFLSGFAASKLSRLFDIVTDAPGGGTPKIFQRVYLSRILLFSCSFLVSVAAQYNVRQYGAGSVLVAADPASRDVKTGEVQAHAGKSIQFSGISSYDQDGSVQWSVSDPGIVTIDGGTGLFCFEHSKRANDKQVVQVLATSRWNHTTQKQMPVTLIVAADDPDPSPCKVAEPATDKKPPKAQP